MLLLVTVVVIGHVPVRVAQKKQYFLASYPLIRAQLKHKWNAFRAAPDGRNYRVHPGTPLRASSLT